MTGLGDACLDRWLGQRLRTVGCQVRRIDKICQSRDGQRVGGAGIDRYLGRKVAHRTLGMNEVNAQPVDGRRPVCILHHFRLRLGLGEWAGCRLYHAQASRQLHLQRPNLLHIPCSRP